MLQFKVSLFTKTFFGVGLEKKIKIFANNFPFLFFCYCSPNSVVKIQSVRGFGARARSLFQGANKKIKRNKQKIVFYFNFFVYVTLFIFAFAANFASPPSSHNCIKRFTVAITTTKTNKQKKQAQFFLYRINSSVYPLFMYACFRMSNGLQ